MFRSAGKIASRLGVALLLGASIVGAAHDARAAAAYNTQQQLSAQTIEAFKNNPAQLLQQFPDGGGALISRLRDLLASDSSTLEAILSLIPQLNAAQKSAFGAALAQAARLYVRADQATAAQIQQAIADTKDAELILAYTAAAGDQPIGAAGGAPGSAGSSGGPVTTSGGTLGGGGSIEGIGGGGVPTGQFSYTGSVTGSSGSTTTTNTTTTSTVSSSVSP